MLDLGDHEMEHARRGAGDVIVAREVDRSHAAVGGAVDPVVADVISDIEITGETIAALREATGKAPVAPGAAGHQVVMKAADIPADAAGVAVHRAGGVVLVIRDVQWVGYDAALKRDVARPARADGFILAPADRAVIDDAV